MSSPRTIVNIMLGPAAKIANSCGVIIADLRIPAIRYAQMSDLLDAKKITMQGVEEILWSLYYQEFDMLKAFCQSIIEEKISEWDCLEELAMRVYNQFPTALEMAEYLGVLIAGSDDEIDVAIDAVLDTKPKALDDYRKGKVAALGAIVGMIMKGQKFSPAIVKERLLKKIGS